MVRNTERNIYLVTRGGALVENFGDYLQRVTWVDVQVTFGLSSRGGLANARHIETAALWILYLLERGERELRKVRGSSKSANVLTEP